MPDGMLRRLPLLSRLLPHHPLNRRHSRLLPRPPRRCHPDRPLHELPTWARFMSRLFTTYKSVRRPLAAHALPAVWLPRCDDRDDRVDFGKDGLFPPDLGRKRLQIQGPTTCRYKYKYTHGGGGVPLYRGGVVWTIGEVVKRE